MRRVVTCCAIMLFALAANADEFQLELGIDYTSESVDVSAPVFGTITPVPLPVSMLSISTDIDTVGFFASWYLQPVDDTTAPRNRAAFASRRSSVSVSYRQSDATTNLQSSTIEFVPFPTLDPPSDIGVLPPFILPPDATPVFLAPAPAIETEDFSFGGRYIFQDSGWYILGGAAFGSASIDNIPNSDFDVTIFTIGGGLYIGNLTTVDVSIVNSDADGNALGVTDDAATDIAVSFSHIGDLGDRWQFGLDAGIVFKDVGDDRLRLEGSLYPTRDIAFGLSVESRSNDFLDDGSRYSIFGSWFVSPNVKLFASLGRDDLDSSPGTDIDGDHFGLGVVARF